jgi:hypothetical protein
LVAKAQSEHKLGAAVSAQQSAPVKEIVKKK